MNRFILLFLIAIASFSAYSQSYMQKGDSCFESGNYACAIKNYDQAFQSANGKDKQITEIKLIRAKFCEDHIELANIAFSLQQYSIAKTEYQKVLDSNPKDSYAKLQLEKCNKALAPPELRKATSADIKDIWDGKYGINPNRRQRLINAGIDPDDAQSRISRGEGKPPAVTQTSKEKEIVLSVSVNYIFIKARGERINIDVKTNANAYRISSLPSWCKIINQYSSWFLIECDVNSSSKSRSDWFKVIAGDKEVKITVNQAGSSTSTYVTTPVSNTANYNNQSGSIQKSAKTGGCFNCPKTTDTKAITFGFFNRYSHLNTIEGIQVGLKTESLFKYGFGFNRGFNIEAHYDSNSTENVNLAFNIPLHLEYRFNFSKWFNLFGYGGVGLNAVTTINLDYWSLPLTVEYGGGVRFNKVQFRLGKSEFIGDFKDYGYIGKYISPYNDFIFSLDIFF